MLQDEDHGENDILKVRMFSLSLYYLDFLDSIL